MCAAFFSTLFVLHFCCLRVFDFIILYIYLISMQRQNQKAFVFVQTSFRFRCFYCCRCRLPLLPQRKLFKYFFCCFVSFDVCFCCVQFIFRLLFFTNYPLDHCLSLSLTHLRAINNRKTNQPQWGPTNGQKLISVRRLERKYVHKQTNAHTHTSTHRAQSSNTMQQLMKQTQR